MDLALNNLQWLICHINPNKQPTNSFTIPSASPFPPNRSLSRSPFSLLHPLIMRSIVSSFSPNILHLQVDCILSFFAFIRMPK